jgi:hypothetical protein
MPRPVVPIFSAPAFTLAASRAMSMAAWNGRISGQPSLTRRRERTSTPAFSRPAISSNNLPTESTTPLPM